MYVLLKGILPWEIKLLLSCLVFDKLLFSLGFMNDCIKDFMYGSSEVKKMSPKSIFLNLRGDNKLLLSGIKLSHLC